MSQNEKVMPATLPAWLTYLESIHPKNIDMGLERLQQVMCRLPIDLSASTVITVAGTNGKGTTCAMIEQACLAAEKSVAVYSSPHLLDFRERVRIDQQMLSAEAFCQAFTQIEAVRGDISLTYFEFTTLAAFLLITDAKPDVAILEVGLGGRLDAVNIIDPDLAIITSIDLDHQDWLGSTRDAIGFEKAGILRANKAAIIGETDVPASVLGVIEQKRVNASFSGRDFTLTQRGDQWIWHGKRQIEQLPAPSLVPMNAATALAAIEWLALPLTDSQLRELVASVQLPGRCQMIHQEPIVILDVAHNPHACRYLVNKLSQLSYARLHIVVGMLKDKDSANCLPLFNDFAPHWYCASLHGPRGSEADWLLAKLPADAEARGFETVTAAYQQALASAAKNDLVLVFGSFHTVADVLQYNAQQQGA